MSGIIDRVLRVLPDPFCRFPDELKKAQLRNEVGQRIRESDSDWKPGHKVFGIGLSRTGTTSLSVTLEQLGYNSLHWERGGEVIGWPEFFWTDAATDVPCSAQFESLYYTFEESKFIYTVRDIESWKSSIINLTGIDSPDKWDPDRGYYTRIRRIQIWESLYRKHDSWEEAYHAFDRRVQRFFEDKPDDRFLKLNITAGEGWEPLCSFLEHPVPDWSFPHANQSDDN